jgi:hypothetical protein
MLTADAGWALVPKVTFLIEELVLSSGERRPGGWPFTTRS